MAMSFRSRRVQVVAGMVAVWMTLQGLVFAFLAFVFLDGYAVIEVADARRDVARAESALSQVERRLAGSGQDWSDWSDNYDFLRGTNPSFLEENLNAGHMRSMQLDLMAFADPAGALVHVEGFDIDGDHGVDVSPADRAALAAVPGLLRRAEDEGALVGIVDLPSGPMVVAALPVRTTEGQGPAAGTLVFGVRIGRHLTEQLTSMVQLPVRIGPAGDLDGATLEAPRMAARGRDELVLVAPLRTLDGHTLELELREPRTVWLQGLSAARTGMLLEAAFSACVAIGAAVLACLVVRAREGRAAVERMTVALQQCSADAIVLVDATNLQVVHANPAAVRINGSTRPGATLFDALLVQPAALTRALDAVSPESPARLDYSVEREDGRMDIELTLVPLTVDDRPLFGAVARDVSERRMREERDRHFAWHDALTGLANRSRFQERLQDAVAVAARDGHRVGVVFIDLDGFKEVNDTLGHDVADHLLVALARRIEDGVRPGDLVARLGGDEFLVLLSTLAQDGDDTRVVDRLLDLVRIPTRVGDRELSLSASIGLATYPDDGTDAAELIRRADMAMYAAKESGRNGWQAYNASMQDRLRRAAETNALLAHAIERGELEVHYQPQVSSVTGQLVGVEALVRWRRPEGYIPPSDFIPVAEQSGLVVSIGEWVLRTALTDAMRWKAEGLGEIRVAVNLSARQFRDPALLETVRRALGDTGAPTRLLELEITESLAMRNPESARRVMEELGADGVTFALDDFGTGYSSLAYLRQFPIDRLKIDRSFLLAVATRADHRAIVAAIIDLAHAVKLEVVAEGVETREQLEFLSHDGCDLLQGFGLSRPVPADVLGEILRSGEPLTRRLTQGVAA